LILKEQATVLEHMHTREYIIKIYFKGTGHRMDLPQYKAQGLAVLNTVINIWFHRGKKYEGG
jgi:hypothetical protein